MPLVYAAVADDDENIVSEGWNLPAGRQRKDIRAMVVEVLNLAGAEKKSYTAEGFSINHSFLRGHLFVCVATDEIPTRFCFGLLAHLESQFDKEKAFRFRPIIKEALRQYSDNVSSDTILKIEGALADVRGEMQSNVNSLLSRGERTDELEETMVLLEEQAILMRAQAAELRGAVSSTWSRRKLCLGIGIGTGVLLLLVLGIVMAACGSDFKKC